MILQYAKHSEVSCVKPFKCTRPESVMLEGKLSEVKCVKPAISTKSVSVLLEHGLGLGDGTPGVRQGGVGAGLKVGNGLVQPANFG